MFGDPLLVYLQNPNAGTFSAFFESYYRLVLKTAYRVTSNAQAAHDVAQDVFLQFLERRPEEAVEINPRAFVARIANQSAYAWARDERKRRKCELDAAVQKPTPARVPTVDDWPEIEELEPELREVVRLRLFDRLDWDDIATLTDCNPRTVRRRFDAATTLLRSRLGMAVLAALLALPREGSAAGIADSLRAWAAEAGGRALPPAARSLALRVAGVAALVVALPLAILFVPRLFSGNEGNARTIARVEERAPNPAPVKAEERPGAAEPARPADPAARTALAASVSGRVLAWYGALPVAGAELRTANGAVKPAAVTGEDGAFVVRVPAGEPLSLLVTCAGLIPSRLTVSEPPARPIVVYLTASNVVRVKVVGREAEAIAGAELKLSFPAETVVASGRSNAEGVVALSPPAWFFTIRSDDSEATPVDFFATAEASGFEANHFQIRIDDVEEGREALLVHLEPCRERDGLVVDPAGNAVADAEVRWIYRVEPALSLGPSGGASETLSDAQGAFQWQVNPRAGVYFMVATKERFAPAYVKLDGASLESDEPLTLHLAEAHEFQGTIHGEDGAPLPRTIVLLEPEDSALARQFEYRALLGYHGARGMLRARTDSRGEMLFRDVPGGLYQVVLKDNRIPVGDPVTIPCDGAWEGKLDTSSDIVGLIVDPLGASIDQAVVIPKPSDSAGTETTPRPRITCDDKGGFRIHSPREFPLDVLIVGQGFGTVPWTIPACEGYVVCTVDPKEPGDAPPPLSLQARLSWDNALPHEETACVTFTPQAGGTSNTYSLSLRKGFLSVFGLPAGIYDVNFRLAGFQPAAFSGVVLPRGETIDVSLSPEVRSPEK